MERPNAFLLFDRPSGFGQRRADQLQAEHVMVQAAVLGVQQGTRAELLAGACRRVTGEVVEGENLFQMGKVMLSRRPAKIVLEMLQCGDGAPVVEGAPRVGHRQHQLPAGTCHASPLLERRERIGHMFEAVRGEHEIVAIVRDAGQTRGFAKELGAWFARR